MNTFLRQRRTLMRMSQGQVADELGVSQQTVARWETSGQIPAKYMKDLAILMGARAQDFLPRSDKGPGKQGATNGTPLNVQGSDEGGEDEDSQLPFGDVCFRFAGDLSNEATCFPVTWGTLNHIQEQLGDAGLGFPQLSQWVHFKALNNKWVLVNTKQVERITFVNDDVSVMTDYEHREVYAAARALWHNMPTTEEMAKEDFPYSTTLVEQVAVLIAQAGEEPWIEFDGLTLKFNSGQSLSKGMNSEVASSLDFLVNGAGEVDPQMQGFLQLTFRDDGGFEHVRLEGVRYIEASLLAFLEACDEDDDSN